MIKFNKPETLNGEQLLTELKLVNIKIDRFPFIDGNGDFWLAISESDKVKAEPIVAAHIGIDQTEAKAQAKAEAEAKLAKLGLTPDDLRALGL